VVLVDPVALPRDDIDAVEVEEPLVALVVAQQNLFGKSRVELLEK